MATQDVTLRPGDSISLKLEISGQALRLNLSLTPDGVVVGEPEMLGEQDLEFEDTGAEPLDISADFDDHHQISVQASEVESLAAVQPLNDFNMDTPPGIPAVQQVDEGDHDDLDFDLDDIDGEEEFTVNDAPALEVHDEEVPIDAELADGLDGPDNDGFSADGLTMLPPTGGPDEIEPEPNQGVELDDDGNPKKKFTPNKDDTLPVWTEKATFYQDPELKEKRETAKLKQQSEMAPKPAAAASFPTGDSAGEDGNFTVFLSPPKGAEKKQAAAEIISDIQGIDMNSALNLAGKMIVPVVKNASEDQAHQVRDRFKQAGLNCRITQKR